jgi:copper chaperone CopZ
VRTIEREVGELPGVRAVKADVASKIVTIEWQEPATGWEAIRSLLVEINYPPEGA